MFIQFITFYVCPILFEIQLIKVYIIITVNVDIHTSNSETTLSEFKQKQNEEHIISTSNQQGHGTGNFFEISFKIIMNDK